MFQLWSPHSPLHYIYTGVTLSLGCSSVTFICSQKWLVSNLWTWSHFCNACCCYPVFDLLYTTDAKACSWKWRGNFMMCPYSLATASFLKIFSLNRVAFIDYQKQKETLFVCWFLSYMFFLLLLLTKTWSSIIAVLFFFFCLRYKGFEKKYRPLC